MMLRVAMMEGSSYPLRELANSIDESLNDRSAVLGLVDIQSLLDNPLIFVDIGARGGLPPVWKAFEKFLRPIYFEPDPEEFRRLSEVATTSLVFHSAISGSIGARTLYLTKKRACSSLLEPHGLMSDLLAESIDGGGKTYGNTERFDVESEVTVNCGSIDSVLGD